MALNSSLPFSPCPPSQPWVPPDDLYEDYYWKPLVDCMTETPRFSDIITDDNAWTSRALEPLLDEAPDYRYELWTCVLWLWRLKSLYEQGSDGWYWKKTVWACSSPYTNTKGPLSTSLQTIKNDPETPLPPKEVHNGFSTGPLDAGGAGTSTLGMLN